MATCTPTGDCCCCCCLSVEGAGVGLPLAPPVAGRRPCKPAAGRRARHKAATPQGASLPSPALQQSAQLKLASLWPSSSSTFSSSHVRPVPAGFVQRCRRDEGAAVAVSAAVAACGSMPPSWACLLRTPGPATHSVAATPTCSIGKSLIADIIGSVTLLVVKGDERVGAYRQQMQHLQAYTHMNALPQARTRRVHPTGASLGPLWNAPAASRCRRCSAGAVPGALRTCAHAAMPAPPIPAPSHPSQPPAPPSISLDSNIQLIQHRACATRCCPT